MRKPHFYRYFFGFQPDQKSLISVRQMIVALGLDPAMMNEELLHLTLFVFEESEAQRTDIADHIAAILSGANLTTCRIKLGKGKRDKDGARIKSIGKQWEIQHFYRQLVTLVAPLGVRPRYRSSGLSPHITLDYRKGGPERSALIPFEWIPGELLLIESCVGLSVHNVIARWPLLSPQQGELDLCAGY